MGNMLRRLLRRAKPETEFCPRGCVWDRDGGNKFYLAERDGGDVLVYDCMGCMRPCEYRRDPGRTGPTAPVWMSNNLT